MVAIATTASAPKWERLRRYNAVRVGLRRGDDPLCGQPLESSAYTFHRVRPDQGVNLGCGELHVGACEHRQGITIHGWGDDPERPMQFHTNNTTDRQTILWLGEE